MGLMKKVDIEIRNSLALSFLHHEIKSLKEQVAEIKKYII